MRTRACLEHAHGADSGTGFGGKTGRIEAERVQKKNNKLSAHVVYVAHVGVRDAVHTSTCTGIPRYDTGAKRADELEAQLMMRNLYADNRSCTWTVDGT
jgi:hypothetical protein